MTNSQQSQVMKMAKILLVAGHGNKNKRVDPGAGGGGYNERDSMRLLVQKIKALVPDVVDIYDMSLDCFQVNGLASTAYKEVIEFHMDGATNANAHGGHVIIYVSYSPDALDTRLKNVIEKHIEIWSGTPSGFSKRNNLQNLNVAANRGISYRLLELGFITNAGDRNKTIGQMDVLAKMLAEAIQNKAIGGTTPPATGDVYTVKSRDTLWSISQKYGVSVADIKNWNGLKSDVITVGQKLIVKNGSRVHTVVKGDTLWSIAKKYNTSVAKLKADNGLKSDNINPGQKLKY